MASRFKTRLSPHGFMTPYQRAIYYASSLFGDKASLANNGRPGIFRYIGGRRCNVGSVYFRKRYKDKYIKNYPCRLFYSRVCKDIPF